MPCAQRELHVGRPGVLQFERFSQVASLVQLAKAGQGVQVLQARFCTVHSGGQSLRAQLDRGPLELLPLPGRYHGMPLTGRAGVEQLFAAQRDQRNVEHDKKECRLVIRQLDRFVATVTLARMGAQVTFAVIHGADSVNRQRHRLLSLLPQTGKELASRGSTPARALR